jgi:chemotaxis protein MotC
VKIAQGDKAAYAAELNQLKTIGAAIAAASPETWRNKREADSLVIYILSGGSLADVTPLLKGDAVIESERSLARGALAYVTNHETDAVGLLEQTDLTALDPRLAGEVAFARSVLETKRHANVAVELLDWSRLLAPGGLVEEAALRREIALLAEAKDGTRLAMLTRQYVTRFAASLYAADFLRDLAGAVARLGLVDEAANYKLLSSAVAALPPDGRREFLLTLAKSGVVPLASRGLRPCRLGRHPRPRALKRWAQSKERATRLPIAWRRSASRSTRSLSSKRASTLMGM